MASNSTYSDCQSALAQAIEQFRPDAEFDASGYVTRLEMNFLDEVPWQSIEPEFRAGPGNETAQNMRAPWSSAALAANSFGPWIGKASQLQLAGITGLNDAVNFEQQFPNGVSRVAPTLDLTIGAGANRVAVESKLLEYVRPHKPAQVAAKYRQIDDARRDSRWYAALVSVPEFEILDAYQLIKHYLGLSRSSEARPIKLVYIYWEPQNAEEHDLFLKHRSEIAEFAKLIAEEGSQFYAISYIDHWTELESLEEPTWIHPHLEALRNRYQVLV